MFFIRLIIMAIIGAAIGWLTNKIALLSLFRPYKPIKIPLFGNAQGLLPKRQGEIAVSVGQMVANDLVNVDDIVTEINAKKKKSAYSRIAESLSHSIAEKIPALGKIVPPNIKTTIAKSFLQRVDIARIVEDKINDMKIEELEEMVMGIMKKEFRHIELLGGVLGFVIGLCQGLITLLV